MVHVHFALRAGARTYHRSFGEEPTSDTGCRLSDVGDEHRRRSCCRRWDTSPPSKAAVIFSVATAKGEREKRIVGHGGLWFGWSRTERSRRVIDGRSNSSPKSMFC